MQFQKNTSIGNQGTLIRILIKVLLVFVFVFYFNNIDR